MNFIEREKIQLKYSKFLDCKCSRYIPEENLSAAVLRGFYRKQYMINDGCIPVIVDMEQIRKISDFYFNGSDSEYQKYRNNLLTSECNNGKIILENIFNAQYSDSKYFFQDKLLYKNEIQKEICSDINRFYFGDYMIIRIPENMPWTIFAHIPFGSGNKDFHWTDTIKIAKFFYDEFGAVPCYFDSVSMEFHLKQQPDFDKIYEFIPQIFSFCFDNIGIYENAYSYADFLCKSPFWHFWWD